MFLMDIFGEKPDINLLAMHTIAWTISDPTLMPTKKQIAFPENQ